MSGYPLGPPPSLLHPESEPGDAAMVVRVGGGRVSSAVPLAQAGGQRPSQQVSALPLPPTAKLWSALTWGTGQQDVLLLFLSGTLKSTLAVGVWILHCHPGYSTFMTQAQTLKSKTQLCKSLQPALK